jgi:hypothetical protein
MAVSFSTDSAYASRQAYPRGLMLNGKAERGAAPHRLVSIVHALAQHIRLPVVCAHQAEQQTLQSNLVMLPVFRRFLRQTQYTPRALRKALHPVCHISVPSPPLLEMLRDWPVKHK